MKTTLDYVAYFEALASRATFIDLFYYDDDEFKDNQDEAEGTLMILFPYSNPISENQNDNTLASRRGGFAIIQTIDSDKGRSHATIEDACEKLCYKVIGEMKRNSRAGIITTDILSWDGSAVDPMIGNWIGYMIEFTFEESINSLTMKLNEDWID
jgi:hypothetical protein